MQNLRPGGKHENPGTTTGPPRRHRASVRPPVVERLPAHLGGPAGHRDREALGLSGSDPELPPLCPASQLWTRRDAGPIAAQVRLAHAATRSGSCASQCSSQTKGARRKNSIHSIWAASLSWPNSWERSTSRSSFPRANPLACPEVAGGGEAPGPPSLTCSSQRRLSTASPSPAAGTQTRAH